MMDIKNLAEQYSDYIIDQRQYFHRCPELSHEEVETTKAIQRQLEQIGVPVTPYPGHTGLLGTIQGGKPGRTVLLRADIDALPIEEHSGESFSATNGRMHACGHDCHIAMLLGAAKILWEVRGQLQGTVRLLFQAAEETTQGAQYYMDHGVLSDVSAVFGMHIWGALDAQKFSVQSGPRMAACDYFTLHIYGEGAHGAEPHKGHDAIVAAAAVVTAVQTMVSRLNAPLNTLVVTIGTISGGQRFNIIADHVEMTGTVRGYAKDTIEEQLRHLATHTAKAYGCEAKLEFERTLPPLINDKEHLNRLAENAVIKLYGEQALGELPKLTGSEDFACYTERVPGYFAFIGCRNEALGAVYPNHSDKFRVDESVLHRGAALYAQFSLDFLANEPVEF